VFTNPFHLMDVKTGIYSEKRFVGNHLSGKPDFSSKWKVPHWKSVNTTAFSGTD
jgi:hypothetical protein